MRSRNWLAKALAFFVALTPASTAWADPCGMVPPIWLGDGDPIVRVGVQKTYAFYRNGVESIVIRPGFSGKADEFGMLIPFPTPPAIRKVADDVFPHLAAAIDPPEVLVDLNMRYLGRCEDAFFAGAPSAEQELAFRKKESSRVDVISREAVGMYEVAVLDAGSAAALKAWMDDHGFRYPEGMDATCDEYVDEGWCFVAVKARVGQYEASQARPGMTDVDASLPAGATFDGHVQAMGFRFRTPEFVVPMRLSVFNEGELRNIVYILNDQPVRIANLAEGAVVRQIPGYQLLRNVSDPLPVRIIGGSITDIPEWRLENLPNERNQIPHNGIARELFASDLLSARLDRLAHPHEEHEKELLEIGERLGLRGPELDALHHAALEAARERMIEQSIQDLAGMTLTVIDSDFPREIVAKENLTFVAYNMPGEDNRPEEYDARHQGPRPEGGFGGFTMGGPPTPGSFAALLGALTLLVGLYAVGRPRKRLGMKLNRVGATLIVGTAMTVGALVIEAQPRHSLVPEPAPVQGQLDASSLQAIEQRASEQVQTFAQLAERGGTEVTRGWAIIALSELGGPIARKTLIGLRDRDESALVQTWAAAGLVRLAETPLELAGYTDRVNHQAALARPTKLRWLEFLADDSRPVALEVVLDPLSRTWALQQDLLPALLQNDVDDFVEVMFGAESQNARNLAAGCLATLAAQGREGVASAVLTALRFDEDAETVPWSGGPLFLPSLPWTRGEALELVRHLVAWHRYCNERGLSNEQRQIHNNLNSWTLAGVLDFQMPGGSGTDTAAWLRIWRQISRGEELP